MSKKKVIRSLLQVDNIRIIKAKLFEIFFSIPFISKPLPKNPLLKQPIGSREIYLELHQKAIINKNFKVKKFEDLMGYRIDEEWFNNLSLLTQTCIKKSELNFNHGRILYSLLSNYINQLDKNKNIHINILETGTARGFSALCMSKALNDNNANGSILTLDAIPHNSKIYWNCISDCEGKKTREELLSPWQEELSNIAFLHGWTDDLLDKIGIVRINFAFLDAQHTKDAVINEFLFINKRQKKGDLIFFDDVTEDLFQGVCKAINEIERNYPYQITKLPFDKKRGYAIGKRII